MQNCRSIPPEVWSHARESLVFYFSRRHQRSDAEDLAQETLLSIWNREDYEFEKEEDFLKVCYGFARHKLQEGYREMLQHEGDAVDDSLCAPQHAWGSSRSTEARILLKQICEIGQSQLQTKEWRIIRESADLDSENAQKISDETTSRVRVQLHRARKKLAKLTGLGEK